MAVDPSQAVYQPLLPEQDQITVSHIYKLTKEELKAFFSGQGSQEALPLLKQHGGASGVLKKLASEANTGIIGDERDLRRRLHFGVNQKPLPPRARLLESLSQTMSDKMWWVVAGTAILSGICGGIGVGWGGLWGGVSIIIASVLLIIITSAADWMKDSRFVDLQALIKEETIPVIRGKFGATQSVSVWKLVVGDVCLLETGGRVPADCIVLEAADLEVDEPARGGEEARLVKKSRAMENEDGELEGDPFLTAGSLITRGQCKVVVCCVGAQSTRGVMDKKLDTDQDTALQRKLKNLSDQFTLYGLYAACFIFILLVVRLVISIATAPAPEEGASEEELATKPSVAATVLEQLSGHIVLCVVLIVVSIPEGLPVTIGMALAFSVVRMNEDKILVRKLDAPEKMGGVEEVLCGKTGTLTKNDMRVAKIYCEGRQINNSRKDTILHCELSAETIERVKEAILYNTDARVEMDATKYVPVGSGTEVALLRFLQDADIPVHLLLPRKLGNILAVSPFSSEKKRSAVALTCPDRPGTVAVYVKGGPEYVIGLCQSMLSGPRSAELGEDERIEINEKIDQMAANPLRVIALAYCEMGLDEWNSRFQGPNSDGNPGRALDQALFSEELPLTFIGAFGLRDQLRPKVPSCIRYATAQRENGQPGPLGVRLVSGDHFETAKAVALKAGILRAEESGRTYAVMHASTFRATVGHIDCKKNEQTGRIEYTIENEAAFREVAEHLRVLARATPADKLALVHGLKKLEKQIAVTGDGINDRDALEAADVGLAMGSGCSAAKEAADIVLTDDDFEATLRAVMWGRNIFHNVSRFLQFQVTVNISCLATVFLGAIIFAESPLSPVQLLWINLIMDTFAAIALSTEPPLKSVLTGGPCKGEGSAVLSKTVWRQILGVSIWNILVMLGLMLFGGLVTGLEYDVTVPTELTDETNPLAPQAQAKRKHFTYIFNVFIFLQIFNYINCRKVGRRDLNVFEEFGHNPYFLMVFFGTFAAQILSCEYFSSITGTEDIEKGEWGACIAIGSTTLLIAAILKRTPDSWVTKLRADSLVNEDATCESAVLDKWNQKDGQTQKGGEEVSEDPADNDQYSRFNNEE